VATKRKNKLEPGESSFLRLLSNSWFIALILLVTTLAAYWPVCGHAFVNFDDQVYVTENAHVRGGLSWESIQWAFTNLEAGFWHPLTWLSILLDCQLYGLKPAGHHLTSLLLHAANTVLLFTLLRKLTGALWRAALVAALFALHPLHVETVAWAADRKDVLSTLFLLLTLLAYAQYVQTKSTPGNSNSPARQSAGWYLLTLGLFALGLMSKTMLVSVPFLLLVLDGWPLKRLAPSVWRRLLLEKLPFFLLSLLVGLLTLHAEKAVGAVANTTQFPLGVRVANALVSTCVYLRQMCWPRDLAVFYPYPEGLGAWQVALAALLLAGVSLAVYLGARSRPYLLAGWAWYLLSLGPVLGLIQVGAHAHADRYTYVPLIGIFIMVAWGGGELARRKPAAALGLGLAAVIALALAAAQTTEQLGYWRNSETLFRHALQVTSRNAMAHYCLGLCLSQQNRSADAIEQFKAALETDPGHAEAHDNLGVELAIKGSLEPAIGHFREAIRAKPSLTSAHANLGMALANQQKLTEAVKEYQTALELKPSDARVHSNLGNALDDLGRSDEALAQYQEALRLDPGNTEIRLNLAVTLAKQGKRQEAATQYHEILRLKPQDPQALRALQALSAQPKP
jgi:tetratricopeptide (TPR) repeat protein